MHDPVMHEYGTMWPVKSCTIWRVSVSVLLDVEPEREGVPEEERGGERAEETLEGGGTVFGDDANVNSGGVPVCGFVSRRRKKKGGRTNFSILRMRGWSSSLCAADRNGGCG